jgi:hypothetical protein
LGDHHGIGQINYRFSPPVTASAFYLLEAASFVRDFIAFSKRLRMMLDASFDVRGEEYDDSVIRFEICPDIALRPGVGWSRTNGDECVIREPIFVFSCVIGWLWTPERSASKSSRHTILRSYGAAAHDLGIAPDGARLAVQGAVVRHGNKVVRCKAFEPGIDHLVFKRLVRPRHDAPPVDQSLHTAGVSF